MTITFQVEEATLGYIGASVVLCAAVRWIITSSLLKHLAILVARLGLFIARSVAYHSQVGVLDLRVQPTGFVEYGGKTFFRDPTDMVLYHVVPGTALRKGDGTFELKDYKLVRVRSDEKNAESALYGSEPISERSSSPNEVVFIYIRTPGGYHYLSAGYREGMFLITSAHTLSDSEGEELVLSRDGKKFFTPSEVTRHYASKEYTRCSGDDVGAFELSFSDWAILGARSVKPSIYDATGLSRIEIYGRDHLGVLKAGVGALKPASTTDRKEGIVPHSASTIEGFSGSPVYTLGERGRRIVGLHIAGGGVLGPNYMASVHELHRLRRSLGLVPTPTLLAEVSPPTKHRQYDRWEDREDDDRFEDDLDKTNKYGGTFGFYDDLKGESAPKPDLPEVKEPELPAGHVDPEVVEDVSEDDQSDYEEEPAFPPSVAGACPPPIGVNRVCNKKVRGIGTFMGVTAFAGAAVSAVTGTPFNPAWMDCSVQSLTEAMGSGYDSMINSPNFAKFREYLNAAKAHEAEEQRVMKGVDGSDVARMFADGISNRSRKKALKRLPAKFLDAVSQLGLSSDFTKWVNPPVGVDAMEQSMQAQLGKTCGTCWPEETRKQFAAQSGPLYSVFLEEVAKYSPNRAPAFRNVHERVTRFVLGLDGDKSAGWSQHFRPGTKRSWQDKEGLELASYLTRCRLLLRVAVGPDVMAQLTPRQMVEAGLSDPRTLFVKVEPTGEDKERDGRWRLIWGASLVDVSVASLTCRRQDKLDIEQYQSGPVEGGHQQAAGLGHHDEGIERLCVEFQRLVDTGLEVFDSDASGWDMTVNRDSIYADALRRILLYEGPAKKLFEYVALCEAAANSAHVVQVGGCLWEILKPGITASGILSTTAQNSFIRALLYALVGIRHCVVAGDDAAGAREKGYDHVAALAAYGPKEKQVNVYDPARGIEFTSHLFTFRSGRWVAKFLNMGKACARLALAEKVREDQLSGNLFCIRHDETQISTFKQLCKSMGWPIDGVKPSCLPFLD